MIHIVRIADIEIGERRREDMGDLAGLAQSIEKWGLLHPVVISEGKLVAGERRLTACRDFLGWEHIECKNLGELTEDELREIELEENLRRKDLTPYERAKTTHDLAQIARKVSLEERSRDYHVIAGEQALRAKSAQKGRPTEPGSLRDIESRTGIPEATIRAAEQHAETAEQFPFMQGPDWKQSHVLEAREHLNALPAQQARVAAEMMNEPGIPPSAGLKMLSNLRHMPEERRERVLDCYQSEDSRLKTFAKTEAIENPCAPDPRVLRLKAAIREHLKPCVEMFPEDHLDLNPRYQRLMDDAKQLAEDTQAAHRAHLEALTRGDANGEPTATAGVEVEGPAVT